MIAILAPSKTMDIPVGIDIQGTEPRLKEETEKLAAYFKDFSTDYLAKMMKLSPKLASLTAERFASWVWPTLSTQAAPCVFVFKGDVYDGLDAESLSFEDLSFAQQHIRILSGLHGILRPLDHILPYRLEMGLAHEVRGHKNMYAFWSDRISGVLRADLASCEEPVLVNLASNEYFKSVHLPLLHASLITPVFMDIKGGTYQVVSFYAKKARGMMARFIIRERIMKVDHIKAFDEDGYVFNSSLSSAAQWVFTRG